MVLSYFFLPRSHSVSLVKNHLRHMLDVVHKWILQLEFPFEEEVDWNQLERLGWMWSDNTL